MAGTTGAAITGVVTTAGKAMQEGAIGPSSVPSFPYAERHSRLVRLIDKRGLILGLLRLPFG